VIDADTLFQDRNSGKVLGSCESGVLGLDFPEGADVVIECTGKPEVWASAIRMVRRGGQVVLFGGCPSGTKISIDTGRLHYDQITLRSPFHYTLEAVRRSYDVLSEGLSAAKQLITAEYPLDQLPKVFSLLRQGNCVKYAVIP
jgi:L-iditol 2-dehydrogenase